jgi:hypothetical protein
MHRGADRAQFRRSSSRTAADLTPTADPTISLLGLRVRLLACREGQTYRCESLRVTYDQQAWGLPDGDVGTYLALSVDQVASLAAGLPPDLVAMAVPAILRKAGAVGKLRQPTSFFNGPIVRLERAVETRSGDASSGGQLELFLCPTNYFTFWGTHKVPEVVSLSRGIGGGMLPAWFLANNLAISVYVQTSDGRVIYTRRSHQVAQHPDLFGPSVSGDMDPLRDRVDGVPRPERAVAQEAGEELGKELARHIRHDNVFFYGLIVDETDEQPILVGEVTVPLTVGEITKLSGRDRRLEIGRDDNLLSCEISASALPLVARQLVADLDQWTPVSLAALVLFLKHQLGSSAVHAAFLAAIQS